MSSACEYPEPSRRQPSMVIIALCVTVCGDCCTSTPGRLTKIGSLVMSPLAFTRQCAAVTTMRLVHKAPLQTVLPCCRRTTAVLPTAEVPPTTALALDVGKTTIVALRTSVRVTRLICRRPTNKRRTQPCYNAFTTSLGSAHVLRQTCTVTR